MFQTQKKKNSGGVLLLAINRSSCLDQIRLIELQHKNEDWLFFFSHSKVNFGFSIFNTREELVFIRPRLKKPEMILL